MTDDTDGFAPDRFALALQRFLERYTALIPPQPSPLRDRVTQHLGGSLEALETVGAALEVDEHPNLQLALNEWLAADPAGELIGVPLEITHFAGFSLGGLFAARFHGPRVDPVAPEYVSFPTGVDETLGCVRLGLYLLHHEGTPILVLVATTDRHGPEQLRVEVGAITAGVSARGLAHLRERMHALNVYRGKVLSFTFSEWGRFGLNFHRLPALQRRDIVLPDHTLAAIERHTVGVHQHAAALLAAGRHLKRGLLLYGPPGTGKTLSVMYLCNQLPGRTTVILSGQAAPALGRATAMARALQPSMVVLEDVDLVAQDRDQPHQQALPLLFQLLNEMDGMAEDADVIFVLTTNRVDLLEHALIARPGRVDQAVEIPLPDDDGRRRLIGLYLSGVELDERAIVELIVRTSGASASLFKELGRRAVLVAAEQAQSPPTATHALAALADLVEHSAPVLQRSLGLEPH
jgi:hypothetical protein